MSALLVLLRACMNLLLLFLLRIYIKFYIAWTYDVLYLILIIIYNNKEGTFFCCTFLLHTYL